MLHNTQLRFSLAVFTVISGWLSSQVSAQTTAPLPPSSQKITAPLPPSSAQTIIITKKKAPAQKITVIIDSNEITVNGKPATEFESDDIDITATPVIANDYGDVLVQAPRFKMKNDMLRDQLKQNMQSNKAFLGVMTEKDEKGAKITEVTDESAADEAGLKEGDIITKIDTSKITGPADLYKVVGKYKPDSKINITYLRDNASKSTTATLNKNDNFRVFSWNSPGGKSFDMGGDNFNVAPFMNHDFNFSFNSKPRLGLQVQDTEDEKGVKVTDADDEGAAAKAGVEENDIITAVNGKNIKSVDDLHIFIKDIKPGDTVKLNVLHDGKPKTIDVKFPKDLKTMDL